MFGWEEAYFGFSSEDYCRVKAVLDANGIRYKSKRFTRSRTGWGGSHSRMAAPSDWAVQYKLLVRKEDVEKARYYVTRALRNTER